MAGLYGKEADPPTGIVSIGVGSDTVDRSNVRAISIEVAGIVTVVMIDGTTMPIPAAALAVGIQHSMRVSKIMATGTTATGIVGWL